MKMTAFSRVDHGERWFSRCTPDRNMRCGELQQRSAATAPRLRHSTHLRGSGRSEVVAVLRSVAFVEGDIVM